MSGAMTPGGVECTIEWDWYDDEGTGAARPAHFDSSLDQWVDLESGLALTSSEIDSLRHYQMKITYDDRVRTQDTQPPGLPRGKGTILGGLKYWEELTAGELMVIEESVEAAPLN